jgi:hypothetical protein
MSDLGVEGKVVSDRLGHELDVNQNVYTQPSMKRRDEAVDSLETALKASWKRLMEHLGRPLRIISQVFEKLERETGFEPATSSLGSWHSTTELLPPVFCPDHNKTLCIPPARRVIVRQKRTNNP